MPGGKPFSPEEREFVRAYWEMYVVKDIACMMGRNEESVRNLGLKMGLKPRKLIGNTVKPPAQEKPKLAVEANVAAPQAWPDGWSLKPPTPEQLRAGR